MSRKSMVCRKGYEHVDFTDLLDELKNEGISSTFENIVEELEKESLMESDSVPGESEYRHRIMSNPQIKYLYSKKLNIIHDKHCPSAKEIPDEELAWSEQYCVDLHACPQCMIRAYIAAGAKDPKEINQYQQFFENVGMTNAMIKNMYVEKEMKTQILSDVMTIWYKEDIWKIKALPQKRHVRLYHNNYKIRKKGFREFTQGFHIQNKACEDTNIVYALSVIKNYEYKPEEYALHSSRVNTSEKMKMDKMQVQKEARGLPEKVLNDSSERLTSWQKIKKYFLELLRRK